jgi:hypothetical protein
VDRGEREGEVVGGNTKRQEGGVGGGGVGVTFLGGGGLKAEETDAHTHTHTLTHAHTPLVEGDVLDETLMRSFAIQVCV